jgi:hypothetical protein
MTGREGSGRHPGIPFQDAEQDDHDGDRNGAENRYDAPALLLVDHDAPISTVALSHI